LRGIRVVATDLFPKRLALAREFGAAFALLGSAKDLPEQIQKLSKKRGLDAAVLAVPSNQALEQAQGMLRGAGTLLLFAHTKRGDLFPVDLASICVDEKRWIGSYSADYTLQRECARLVFSRRLDVRKLVTHRFPLAKTAQAIELAASPTRASLKVMVEA
jgi:L-iditol 2-dehydrogenase